MASVWSELKRRNVVKVAVAYAIVGWLLFQLTDVLISLLDLPEWVGRLVFLLVLVGFPLALIFAWAYELTPEGIKREKDVDRAESITQRTGQKLNYGITGLLVLVVGFILVDKFVLDGATPQSDRLSKSIAVLPFQNLSPDPDNAFFAAGIHESLLNQLFKIRELSVIARTSVLQYETDPPPIPEIAKALNVEMVMEGSARFADGLVLITAQLIDGRTGTQIWSDEFPGDLAEIFAAQVEIAEHIATALEAELTPGERELLARAPTDNTDAYQAFLQSMEIGLPTATIHQYLDEAIRLDPDFAEAHSRQAYRYARDVLGYVVLPDEELPKLEALVRQHAYRALDLDPTLGFAYAAIGEMHWIFSREIEAQLAYEKAVALSPSDPNVLDLYAGFLVRMGEFADAIEVAQRQIQLDPENFRAQSNLGDAYFFLKDPDAAADAYRKSVEIQPDYRAGYSQLGLTEAMRGNDAEAFSQLQEAERFGIESAGGLARVGYGYGRIGRTDDAARQLRQLEAMALAGNRVGPSQLGLACLGVGDHAQALEWFTTAAENRGPAGGFWVEVLVRENTMSDPVLEQAEWVKLRGRLGLGR